MNTFFSSSSLYDHFENPVGSINFSDFSLTINADEDGSKLSTIPHLARLSKNIFKYIFHCCNPTEVSEVVLSSSVSPNRSFISELIWYLLVVTIDVWILFKINVNKIIVVKNSEGDTEGEKQERPKYCKCASQCYKNILKFYLFAFSSLTTKLN